MCEIEFDGGWRLKFPFVVVLFILISRSLFSLKPMTSFFFLSPSHKDEQFSYIHMTYFSKVICEVWYIYVRT